MNRFAFLAASILVVSTPAAAAEIQIQSAGPVIELTVNDTVNAKPDTAIISAGVTNRAMSANEAARQNAQRMEGVIAKLKQLGVAAQDIQTSNFSLYPQYTFSNDGRAPTFVGYDVSNQVTVKVRDIAKVGAVLDALVATGANNFSGPTFTLLNDTASRSEARRNAFTSAEARARELASLAGYKSVKLLELSETYQTFGGGMPPPPMPVAVTASSIDARTPIQPGQVGTSAQLTVKYEMVR